MKNGKKPTREQKKLLASWGINPAEWLVSKDTPDEMVLVHRHIESVRHIRKSGKNQI